MRLPLCAGLVVYLFAITASADDGAPVGTLSVNFDQESDASAFVGIATGEAEKRNGEPAMHDGKLYLMQSWWKSDTSAGFAAPTTKLTRVAEISFTLIMNTGTEGMGFAWLATDVHNAKGAAPPIEKWEEPSLPDCFAVGFDASDPANRDPFRGSGNTYDRPQHELSLHWNNMEIVKCVTPNEYRDEEPHAVKIRIEYIVGGAEITLSIDDKPVFEKYFIAGMLPYVGRPAFGVRNSEIAGDVLIDDLLVNCYDEIAKPEPPTTIVAINHVLNDKDHPKTEVVAEFPENTDRFGRIICTLRLDKPETRFDPWDRSAAIYAYDDAGEKYEILRYITPYHRGHAWQFDITDFRPLLRGETRIEQECGTQGEGWVVSVTFDFYPGPTDRLASKIIKLWNGSPEIGNPEKPVSDFYTPQTIEVDEGVAFAKVYTVVTGHGMSPNSNNAAEFMSIWRTLTANGESWRNELWKTDNYLNPCRPQGGTWKYDRAGWAPGDVVRPWCVDVSHLLKDSRKLELKYELDPYVNENRGQTWAPFHKTESFLILYKKPQAN